jgi:hypothetical protein
MIWDQDLDMDYLESPKEDFINNDKMKKNENDMRSFIPDLYKQNREFNTFNIFTFFYVFSVGIFVAIIIYYFAYFLFKLDIIDHYGHTTGYYDASFASYYGIVVIQNLILFIDIRYWNLITLVAFL